MPRKLQVLETFHAISKSRNRFCDESQSLVFVIFLESRSFELFAVKSGIFKQGLGISASLSQRVIIKALKFIYHYTLSLPIMSLTECTKKDVFSLGKGIQGH